MVLAWLWVYSGTDARSQSCPNRTSLLGWKTLVESRGMPRNGYDISKIYRSVLPKSTKSPEGQQVPWLLWWHQVFSYLSRFRMHDRAMSTRAIRSKYCSTATKTIREKLVIQSLPLYERSPHQYYAPRPVDLFSLPSYEYRRVLDENHAASASNVIIRLKRFKPFELLICNCSEHSGKGLQISPERCDAPSASSKKSLRTLYSQTDVLSSASNYTAFIYSKHIRCVLCRF